MLFWILLSIVVVGSVVFAAASLSALAYHAVENRSAKEGSLFITFLSAYISVLVGIFLMSPWQIHASDLSALRNTTTQEYKVYLEQRIEARKLGPMGGIVTLMGEE